MYPFVAAVTRMPPRLSFLSSSATAFPLLGRDVFRPSQNAKPGLAFDATLPLRDTRSMGSTEESFDYRSATEEDILRFGNFLRGMKVGEIPGIGPFVDSAVKGKGEVGRAVEHYFGMPQNSISDADFPAAGIELKVVPLLRSSKGMRAKERTVISMINYLRLVEEEWPTAHVRKKLAILFVFVEHLKHKSKREFPVRAVHLWRPSSDHEGFIKRDWERVREKVAGGRAHLLSEGDGAFLGPCTKGADSTKRVPQPVKTLSADAKPRAWALKPAFTTALYRELVGSTGAMESLMSNLGVTKIDDFESALAERFAPFVGQTLGRSAEQLGVAISPGKGFVGDVVRRALGAKTAKARIKEFEEMGIDVKATRVSPSGRPYESMSFPAFRYADLLEETWEDSDLLSRLEGGLLICPVIGERKEAPPENCVFGQPILWKPTYEELEVAHHEWEMYRTEIRNGQADSLTPGSKTKMLHVRPHARDRNDTDLAPLLGPVVKKSFWLNAHFIQSLVEPQLAS